MANFKINKKLFEVNYEEIKIGRKIGSGGSSSAVFLAEWKGQKTAFKCYLDDDLFSNKDRFKMFENEVAILASLSHPHVLIFYGACIKPPRYFFLFLRIFFLTY